MGRRVPIWLDCDPGHDDAFAILLAAYHPGIQLLGISTIFGNAPLDAAVAINSKTTWNATSILTAIGKPNIPVYAGAPNALIRPPLVPPTDIHGETGIDGTDLLPRPLTPANTSVSAVDAIAAAIIRTEPNTAWIVATGALTNVASLFRAHPELASHMKGVSLMGGAIGGKFTGAIMGKVGNVERMGNWTQFAEFNILVDPEAADEIFQNPVLKGKTTMIPLDVTHLVLATQEVQGMLLFGRSSDGAAAWAGASQWTRAESEGEKREIKGKTKLRTMLVELLTFFAKTYTDVFGITEGPPLHDPLAVAAVLTGTEWEIPFFDSTSSGGKERYDVHVNTVGTHEEARAGAETGRTVPTLMPEGQEGTRIPRGLDIEMFWQVIEDCLERADEVNSKNGGF
ncbi:putative uridine nucleosidase protein [Zalerion maritima]|uniref:Uridine nucleosidase protein n=1 Tax=Zalerion maritima TaxID=339359 RepID=A0AAD5WRL4_9PEZI|nr:putative uridine nucleosidase protein [Zalerion maritima]